MRKIALITGASRGIGRATALALASQGADVVINCRSRREQAEDVCREAQARGARALVVPGDVSDPEAVDAMFETVKQEWGPVDILVCNAGINRDNLFVRTRDRDFRDIVDVNLFGSFYCAQAAARAMVRKRWGRIVFVSSVVGLRGNVGQTAYSASKAALLGMTRTLARELAGRNITVNAIAPGFVETEMTGDLGEEIQSTLRAQIPAGRFGTPEEIGSLVGFLASEEAAYMTGQTLVMDGGLSI